MSPNFPSRSDPRIVYLTAGAAGMYCGSCLHDNTLARSLTGLGVDIQLVPLYTPIRTDEHDVSVDRLFLGGVNVYLQQKMALFRHLPSAWDRILNHPRLVRILTSLNAQASDTALGQLAVSVLQGTEGAQRKEFARLCDWLCAEARPDVVNFTNMLVAGCLPDLRQRMDVPVVVTLQGDDVFLEALPRKFRDQAIDRIRELVELVDVFVVFSQYYADVMADYLAIPPDKFRIVPLGIDVSDLRHVSRTTTPDDQAFRIGYLARLAPEKGLHILVDAFLRLRETRPDARLLIAGWLGPQHRGFAREQFRKLARVGGPNTWEYRGPVSRAEKLQFLSELDVLSVPATYGEPKGRYVLEALAAAVPVVQPDHGAFPEIIRDVGGGKLVRPADPVHLAETLDRLLADRHSLRRLGAEGRQAVCLRRNSDSVARAMLDVYRQLFKKHAGRR
jgi:glycosyltransferase involved in cell wall biosynthesis